MAYASRKASTFPRLADPLGYVDKDDIFHAVKAIVAVQRDYGRRDDRAQARLKYLVDDWGVPKFRSVVEQYLGKQLQPFRCGPHGALVADSLPTVFFQCFSSPVA